MTWNLVTQSFRLLRSDKKLLVFPVLSAIGAAALALPFLLALFGMRPDGGPHWGPNTWLFVFLWYWGASFITIFFNCALAACVQMRFAGQDPTLADGLRRAASRVDTIFMWSLISATVGQIARAVEERAGWIGRLIIGAVGLGWGMATYLVIPVLVMEDAGVMDSVRRSSSLLRQTWGEQLISGIAFGWLGLLFAIPGVVLGVLGANGYPDLHSAGDRLVRHHGGRLYRRPRDLHRGPLPLRHHRRTPERLRRRHSGRRATASLSAVRQLPDHKHYRNLTAHLPLPPSRPPKLER